MEDFRTLLEEYLKEYPKAENPLNWHRVVSEEEIYEALKNREGREIYLKEFPDKLDSGVLDYK